MSFEMVLNNFEFHFESPDGKIFLNETYINKFLYETQRSENVSVLYVNIRGLKNNFKNFHDLLNDTGSSFNIIC